MQQTKDLHLIIYIIGALLLSACNSGDTAYRIGVSQCAAGLWRDQLNNEMLAAQHLYEHDVKVSIAHAMDSNERQIEQIDSLAATGIDLLVVSPNESSAITEAINRVRARGIPVVCFDRKADTECTAFVGCDNVDAGAAVGNYAVSLARQVSHRPLVLEVTALMSTSPAQERHKGFSRVLNSHKADIDYVCIESDYGADGTYQAVKKQIESGRQPDVVFCHIDGMTTGAWRAADEAGIKDEMKILGFDGLLAEGIAYVQKGMLAGTYQYPTHGEAIVRLALNILTGKPYEKENKQEGVMVTPENVDLIAMNARELANQNKELITIQDKLENYFGLYNSQQKVIMGSLISILLLVIAIVLTLLAIRQRQRLSHEQAQFYTNASHQLKTPLTLIAGPIGKLRERSGERGEWKNEDIELLEIVGRNVTQLEQIVSSVLKFKQKVDGTGIDDVTAAAVEPQSASPAESSAVLRKSHLSMMKHEDSDELPGILIVEDNSDMRRYLHALLSGSYYVMEAVDGESGLRLARENVPDLVLSDVMMPVMDGLQLCAQLKNNPVTSHIPVILLTAQSEESQQMEAYAHGADAYLTKPFKADVLISRIDNLLKSRQQLRTLFTNGQKTEGEVQLTTQDKLFMNKLKEAIKANMSNADLKMDELGEKMGISRVQLYRKVKVLTGLSPVELLRQMRLQRGHTLLHSTTKTVAEIAYEVGFSSPSYFSSCFKKQFGKLPMEQRSE